MPVSDFPQSILFIIFLLLFVLVGIYPTWKKTAAMLRETLRNAKSAEIDDDSQPCVEQADFFAEQQLSTQLNDFELFILKRLAQEPDKPLSRRQINAALHLETAMLKAALGSLQQRSLLRMTVGNLSGIRYSLSASGRSYAINQGFIPCIHDSQS